MGMLLGTYLSRPVTTKYSHDEEDGRIVFGVSSMQGWRETQEDAHNCILDFDVETSYFAVYDGHGGSEVSEYAAQVLPDFLKSNNYYKRGEYENALKDSFLKFDRSLKTPVVVKLLRKLVRMARRFNRKDAGEESLKSLKQEALMPLEEVLAKYALARKKYKQSKHTKAQEANDIDSPSSSKENRCSEVNSIDAECSSSKLNTVSLSESEAEVSSSSSFCAVQKKSLSENYNKNGKVDKSLDSTSKGSEASNSRGCSRNVSENDTLNNESNVSEGNAQPESSKASRSEKPADSPSCSKSVENKDINVRCNGQSVDIQSDEVISSSVGNGEVEDVPKSSGKGKSLVKYQPKKTGGGNKYESSEDLFHKFLFSDIDDDSSESDSDDATFTDPDGKSDDDDDDDDEEEDMEEEEEEEDDDEEEDDLEEEEEEEEGEGENEDKDKDNVEVKVEIKPEIKVEDDVEIKVEKKAEKKPEEVQVIAEIKKKKRRFRYDMYDEECEEECDEILDNPSDEDEIEENESDNDRAFLAPGSDSGCTALVALIKGNRVYVANAGDCRCVVSKNGEAIELSLDHKPENEIELRRIERAGGRVHGGRVNDGLNLSRALGDHVYKRTPGLPPEEQMISPMPDIQIFDLDPDVEFMILACDGIWNSMSSKEVVDFVRPKLQHRTEGVSKICEQLFDHCLAPDTICDGTGCDNMTAIIIQFKHARLFSVKKRPIDENEAEEAPKKHKTEDVTSTDSIDSSQPSESFLEKPSNSPDTTQ